jgi:hypothetical protein
VNALHGCCRGRIELAPPYGHVEGCYGRVMRRSRKGDRVRIVRPCGCKGHPPAGTLATVVATADEDEWLRGGSLRLDVIPTGCCFREGSVEPAARFAPGDKVIVASYPHASDVGRVLEVGRYDGGRVVPVGYPGWHLDEDSLIPWTAADEARLSGDEARELAAREWRAARPLWSPVPRPDPPVVKPGMAKGGPRVVLRTVQRPGALGVPVDVAFWACCDRSVEPAAWPWGHGEGCAQRPEAPAPKLLTYDERERSFVSDGGVLVPLAAMAAQLPAHVRIQAEAIQAEHRAVVERSLLDAERARLDEERHRRYQLAEMQRLDRLAEMQRLEDERTIRVVTGSTRTMAALNAVGANESVTIGMGATATPPGSVVIGTSSSAPGGGVAVGASAGAPPAQTDAEWVDHFGVRVPAAEMTDSCLGAAFRLLGPAAWVDPRWSGLRSEVASRWGRWQATDDVGRSRWAARIGRSCAGCFKTRYSAERAILTKVGALYCGDCCRAAAGRLWPGDVLAGCRYLVALVAIFTLLAWSLGAWSSR